MAFVGAKSGLCATGDAVEIGFRWPGSQVRVTVDPAPEATSEQRLALCLSGMAGRLSPKQLETLAELRDWVGPLAWGGWLGFRQRGENSARKLYVELPSGASWRNWEAHWAGSQAILSVYDPRPVMVGIEEGRPGLEIYQRLAGLCPRGLALLLKRFGFPERMEEVLHALQALTGRRISRDLPSDALGFSVSLSEPGRPLALTVYSISEALLGPAARARSALRSFGARQRWDMTAYESFTAPERRGHVPHHGTVGIVLAHNETMAIATGVALESDGVSAS